MSPTTSPSLRTPARPSRRPSTIVRAYVRRGGERATRTVAVVVLLAVTLVWGASFYLIKDAVSRVPVADYLALRFGIAALALYLVAPRSVLRLSPTARAHGVALGVLYATGQLLQTWGLQHTSASVSGFVTGMYVVLTPILGALLLRHRVGSSVWAAAVVATLGLGVLTLNGFSIGVGEAVTLVSAAFYALHILGLGAWANGRDVMGLAVVQMATVAVVCGAFAAPGGFQVPTRTGDWVALAVVSLLAGAFALVAQTWAQAHLPAARAAVIMTMEPVFAGAFAVGLGGELLTWRLLIGGAIVLLAMFLAEFGPREHADDVDVCEEVTLRGARP